MPEDREVIVTIHVRPESVEVDSSVGSDADDEAFALCDRLFDTVRDFIRADTIE
jgi:hypothetical protein